MTPFYVEAELSTPIAFSPPDVMPTALDGLLAWAVLAGGRSSGRVPLWPEDLAAPAPDIPLARVRVGGAEVWAGSVGFPVGDVRWGAFGWTKKWAGRRRWRSPKSRWDPSEGSGPFRDRKEFFLYVAARRVRFYGLGDLGETLRLLRSRVPAIGHKHRRGFGRVREWRGGPLPCDHSVWLRAGGAVYPARPLPPPALAEEPGAVGVPMPGRLDPPHWLRGRMEELLYPPPFLWQEGLRDGPPDRPEPNPVPWGGTDPGLAGRLAGVHVGFGEVFSL